MENDPLTGIEKKELRGIGQRLKPHLHIGKNGLSATASKEIDKALLNNGLIKIRFKADREVIKNYCNNSYCSQTIYLRSIFMIRNCFIFVHLENLNNIFFLFKFTKYLINRKLSLLLILSLNLI